MEETIRKQYGGPDLEGVADSPYYAVMHDAIQSVLDSFTPGITVNTIFTREEQKAAIKEGITPEIAIHGMRTQTLHKLLQDYVVPNIAFSSEKTPDDSFVLTGSTICMAEEQFGNLLVALETAIVKAAEAAVETAVAARAAKLAS